MDWNAAVLRQRAALAGILAGLVAMAGDRPDTLPRHLHRAVLRLLRPAEAAARRLVIAMARGIAVPPPPPCRAWSPSPASQGRIRGGDAGATSILLRLRRVRRRGGTIASPRQGAAQGGGGGNSAPAPVQKLSLPLFDPLRGPRTRRPPAPAGVPRISVPGSATKPFPVALRRPPLPEDPIDAARLNLRLKALAAALDDLPGAARRFARWRATSLPTAQAGGPRRDAGGRSRRVWPLRPGRPPGWRRGRLHAVHEVLNEAHWLALTALERRDTS